MTTLTGMQSTDFASVERRLLTVLGRDVRTLTTGLPRSKAMQVNFALLYLSDAELGQFVRSALDGK